jgi:hypothetical protein
MNIRKLLSPSTLIATAAVVVATGGSAIAAGEIITAPNQIANNVISTGHLQNRTIEDTDLRDPQLKLRVSKTGQKLGVGDGVVTRASTGVYDISFNPGVFNPTGVGDISMVSENCAINVTSRAGSGTFDAFHAAYVVRTTGPNSVRVIASDVDLDRLIDTAFDLTASC